MVEALLKSGLNLQEDNHSIVQQAEKRYHTFAVTRIGLQLATKVLAERFLKS